MRVEEMKERAKENAFLRRILAPIIALRRRRYLQRKHQREEVVNRLQEILAAPPMLEIKEFEGVFAFDSRSDLFKRILVEGMYEPELVAQCLHYLDAEKDALDIGANIGLFSVLLAKHLRRRKVLAVEPTQRARRWLHENLVHNHVRDRVIVFEGAASDRQGQTTIQTIPGKEEYSSLGVMEHPAITGESCSEEQIFTDTVDHLVELYGLTPGFMKVDVEGAEHLVFSGAQRVLKQHRPVILSELSDFLLVRNGSSAAQVIGLIRSCGYDIIDPRHPNKPPGKLAFGDILCVPQELRHKFNNLLPLAG